MVRALIAWWHRRPADPVAWLARFGVEALLVYLLLRLVAACWDAPRAFFPYMEI